MKIQTLMIVLKEFFFLLSHQLDSVVYLWRKGPLYCVYKGRNIVTCTCIKTETFVPDFYLSPSAMIIFKCQGLNEFVGPWAQFKYIQFFFMQCIYSFTVYIKPISCQKRSIVF